MERPKSAEKKKKRGNSSKVETSGSREGNNVLPQPPTKVFAEIPWLQFTTKKKDGNSRKSDPTPIVKDNIEVIELESDDDENISVKTSSGAAEKTDLELDNVENDEMFVSDEENEEISDSDEQNEEISDSNEENEEISVSDEENEQISDSDDVSKGISGLCVEENEVPASENAEDSELENLLVSDESGETPIENRDLGDMEMELELEESIAEVEEPPVPTPFLKKLKQGIFYRKMDCNSVFVAIVPGESLYFSGKCSIKVLKGVIEVYGCQLTSEEPKRIIFSPKGHSLLSIVSLASESEMDRDGTNSGENAVPLDTVDGESAMLVLEVFENEWCEGMRSYCLEGESIIGPSATGIGPGKIPKLNEFSSKLGFQFISPTTHDKSRLFSTSPLWDEVLYSLQLNVEAPRIAIFGGKGVGKSTYFRWTVNKCLSLYGQSVLCIDLDPGQAEFTPPGMVSVYLCQEPLLGPNFTHLVQPQRAIFIGSVNVSECPTTYKNALKSLFQFVEGNEDFSKIPWIINTMGFSQGLGVHLACDVIKIFQPTAVVQITIENRQRSFPFELTREKIIEYESGQRVQRSSRSHSSQLSIKEYQFFTIESVCNAKNERNQNSWGGRPKDLRENSIVSHFAQVVGSTTDCNFLSIVPYQVHLKDVAIGTMSSGLSYENILRALNGNLVALCEFPESAFISRTPDRKYICNGSSVTNSCFGYGVVRAMDSENGILFVTTPVPKEILEKVNAIISAGSIGLPIQFYVNGTNPGAELPYIAATGSSKTKLDRAAKKQFNYKRTVPNVLKNSLR